MSVEYGDFDDDVEFDPEDSSRYERCDCRLCRCFIETEGGVTCDYCLGGAHQG